MESRTIRLKLLTQTSLVVISTNIRTRAELESLPELSNYGIVWEESNFIDRASKITLELASSVLPAIDCILIQTPKATKAGSFTTGLEFGEIKRNIKKLKDAGVNIPFNYTNSSKEVLKNFLDVYYATLKIEESKEAGYAKPDSSTITIELTQEQVSKIVSHLEINKDVIISLTSSQLDKEVEEILSEITELQRKK